MKLLIFTFSLAIIVSTFCSLLSVNEARREPIDDYWKKVMKAEPMPEALQKLFPKEEEEKEKVKQQQLAVEDEVEEGGAGKLASAASIAALVKTERFSSKFGSKSTFIIYHTLSTKHHNPFSASVPPNH